MNTTSKPKFNPMSTKELAALYRVKLNIFRRWLHPYRDQIGQKVGRLYRPSQVKKIIEILGDPE